MKEILYFYNGVEVVKIEIDSTIYIEEMYDLIKYVEEGGVKKTNTIFEVYYQLSNGTNLISIGKRFRYMQYKHARRKGNEYEWINVNVKTIASELPNMEGEIIDERY